MSSILLSQPREMHVQIDRLIPTLHIWHIYVSYMTLSRKRKIGKSNCIKTCTYQPKFHMYIFTGFGLALCSMCLYGPRALQPAGGSCSHNMPHRSVQSFEELSLNFKIHVNSQVFWIGIGTCMSMSVTLRAKLGASHKSAQSLCHHRKFHKLAELQCNNSNAMQR